jgi:hypothetical protein
VRGKGRSARCEEDQRTLPTNTHEESIMKSTEYCLKMEGGGEMVKRIL